MKKAKRTPILILGGMFLVSLGMSVPSMSCGELLSPVPVEVKTTKIDPSPKENKEEAVPFPSESTGLRAEESEVGQTSDHLLPLQRTLNTKDPELVETTDASGGIMINLQGKFQSGLKVPHDAMDSPVEEPLSPMVP